MTAILTALGSGISARKILEFLSRKSPDMGEKITKALASGLSAEKVLKFFSKDQNFDKLKQSMENQYPMENNANPLVQAQNVRSQNLGNDMASGLQRQAPAILGGAAALGTGLAMQHAIPRILQGGMGAASQQTTSKENPQETLINPQTSQPPVEQANIQQQQALPQPELKTISAIDVLSKNNFIDKVDSLINSGNDANAIDGFYRKFNPAAVKQIEKEAGKPFEEVVNEYIQTKPPVQPPEEMPPESGGQEPPKPKYPPPPKGGGLLSRKAITESFENAPVPTESVDSGSKLVDKVAKGQIVETPDGIGEVREIRNGKALVEVDGKMRKMLEEELMSPGIPQKDLADLHDELIQGIKTQTGKEVSRHVEWAGYDPEHKELVYRPWGDKEYVYDNIDPEDVEMLTNLLTQRKTTGENYIGSWEAGTESPIGAAMHALITKVRNKAKESGQEKAHKRRYEAVYSAYEPAQKASKQKKEAEKKRLKDEEKRRKKAEKQALQHSRSPSRVS